MGEMKSTVRMHKHPLKSAGFRVLKAPDVPSVLVELGYVSNKGDLEHLVSESWRSRTVGSMAQAIDAFLAKRLATAGAGELKAGTRGRSAQALVWPQRRPYKKPTRGLRNRSKLPRRTDVLMRPARTADRSVRRGSCWMERRSDCGARAGTDTSIMRLLVRFLGFLFAAGTIVFLVGVAAAAGLIWHFSKDLPDYSQLQDYEPPVMTRVHASDGSLLGEYSKERRLYLPIQAVPKLVINAFLAAEDKNFYEHGGIDFSGMARAAVLYAQNYGSNRRPQGASTITQQVAKNFLLTNEVSFTRKIKEALLAMRIERTYSKDKILELYLNEIYLGLGAYGIAAASLVYFDKSVNELTVAEAAYLAALPKAPAALHPVRNRDRAIERRNYVIDRLLENGWIKQADADKARKDPLDRHQPRQRRAHFRRRVFCRGSPPRHLRALRREEALRGRPVGAHHARSEAAGDGAQDHGRRSRQLRRGAGLSRRASASSTSPAIGA